MKIYENIRKYSKIFENIRKYSKIFENIRKYMKMFERKSASLTHVPTKIFTSPLTYMISGIKNQNSG